MFYFEFQGYDKDISSYYLAFVRRKDAYPSEKIQRESYKFVCYDEELSFEAEAEYAEDSFINYCIKDMNI